MSLRVRRMAAAGAGLLRKAIPARGWRRYAVGTIVVALAATGTVTATGALPAQAAHMRTAQTGGSRQAGRVHGSRESRACGLQAG